MSTRRRDELLVHLDARELGVREEVGRLRRDGFGQSADLSFEYAPSWLRSEGVFALEPSLNLIPGEQRRSGGGLFGIFSDAAPDLWGRRLLERRERYVARREGRAPRNLDEWDFLVGVNDLTRMGALRVARPSDGAFVSDDVLAVPPQATLGQMQAIARELERGATPEPSDLDLWLRLVIAPGASLGGARPKATFVDAGALWIAKFPSRNDLRDVGGWEYVMTRLAERAGVSVPETKVAKLGSEYSTFCARRFDRDGPERRLFASAMTLLDKRDHADDVSYLDIAAAIELYGPAQKEALEHELEQLFRRVVFNAVAGNRDDHLRNHGFLRDGAGWRLSPAFDLNPIPDKHEHELAFDASTRAPDLSVIEKTARLYRLSARRAGQVIRDVREAAAPWRDLAREVGIPRDEIEVMAPAFQI